MSKKDKVSLKEFLCNMVLLKMMMYQSCVMEDLGAQPDKEFI